MLLPTKKYGNCGRNDSLLLFTLHCTMADEHLRHYVNLSNKPTRFEPTSKTINVYYDEVRKQVIYLKRWTVFCLY